jgi:hypothetical protein
MSINNIYIQFFLKKFRPSQLSISLSHYPTSQLKLKRPTYHQAEGRFLIYFEFQYTLQTKHIVRLHRKY